MVQEFHYVNGLSDMIVIPDMYLECLDKHIGLSYGVGAELFDVFVTVSHYRTSMIYISFRNIVDWRKVIFDDDSLKLSYNNGILSFICTPQYAYLVSEDYVVLKDFLNRIKCSISWDNMVEPELRIENLGGNNVKIGRIDGVGTLIKTGNGYKWNHCWSSVSTSDMSDFLARYMMSNVDNSLKVCGLKFGSGVFMSYEKGYFRFIFKFNMKCYLLPKGFSFYNIKPIYHGVDKSIIDSHSVSRVFGKSVLSDFYELDDGYCLSEPVELRMAYEIVNHKELISDILGVGMCIVFGGSYDCYMLRDLLII